MIVAFIQLFTDDGLSSAVPRWSQRIQVQHEPLHAECRRDSLMRRAKTDLTEVDLGRRRSRLPIFVSNENARVWLDINNKSNSLDALDDDHHYVNVAPPRPPKLRMEVRRSTPVYVNVYSLGRRKPGDVSQTGR